jgi:predicted small secreted protein
MKTPSASFIATSPSPRAKHPLGKLTLLLASAALAGSLASCNTMAGLGRDTQKVGNKLEQKAHEVAR